MNLSIAIWLAFTALSIADGVLTFKLLKNPRNREANPVLASVFRTFGVGLPLLLFKGGLVVTLGWGLWVGLPWIQVVGGALTIVMAWVVCHNIDQVRA